MRWLAFFIAAAFALLPADAAILGPRGGGVIALLPDIYVATNGSDSNTGTLASPFLTIGKAKTAAQARIALGQCPTIWFRAGTYPVASTLSFGTADSGVSSGCVVTWQSYTAENAIWSGGTDLTGTFSLCTTADAVCNSGAGGIYQSGPVTLTAFRELYVNGSHRSRAFTATGLSSWVVGTNGYTSITSGMNAWGNQSNIEVITAAQAATTPQIPGSQQVRCVVSSISGTSATMQTPCWTLFKTYSVGVWGATTPWFIENAYELMGGCTGCWYYNRTTHMLYYLPNGGENMASVSVIAPQTVDLLSGTNVSNIAFKRLTFSYSTWNPDVGGNDYISIQNGWYCINTETCTSTTDGGVENMDSAITFGGTTANVTFDHNLFTHLGSRSLFFKSVFSNVNITANVFTDNGGGAVQIDNAITAPSAQNTGMTFQNNQVDGPFQYLDSGGIFTVFATNSLVDHNLFNQNGWAPLTTGWEFGYNSNNTVSNNKIVDPCFYMLDCGAIYTRGNATAFTVNNNYVRNDNASVGTVIASLYPDQNSTNQTLTNNVIDVLTTTNWLFINWASNNHITATNNCAVNTTTFVDNGSNDTISGTVSFARGSLPSSPVNCAAIAAAAGIQGGVTPGP
jgi:hypothetical protein